MTYIDFNTLRLVKCCYCGESNEVGAEQSGPCYCRRCGMDAGNNPSEKEIMAFEDDQLEYLAEHYPAGDYLLTLSKEATRRENYLAMYLCAVNLWDSKQAESIKLMDLLANAENAPNEVKREALARLYNHFFDQKLTNGKKLKHYSEQMYIHFHDETALDTARTIEFMEVQEAERLAAQRKAALEREKRLAEAKREEERERLFYLDACVAGNSGSYSPIPASVHDDLDAIGRVYRDGRWTWDTTPSTEDPESFPTDVESFPTDVESFPDFSTIW